MAISMLKIRRPLGRLIFNMGIALPGKTVFLIETAPWFSRKFLVVRAVRVGHYLGPGQNCSVWCFLPRVRDFVAVHVCTLAGLWRRPVQPVHFCHHSEIQHYHVFPAYSHQCASPPATYTQEPVHLCDTT